MEWVLLVIWLFFFPENSSNWVLVRMGGCFRHSMQRYLRNERPSEQHKRLFSFWQCLFVSSWIRSIFPLNKFFSGTEYWSMQPCPSNVCLFPGSSCNPGFKKKIAGSTFVCGLDWNLGKKLTRKKGNLCSIDNKRFFWVLFGFPWFLLMTIWRNTVTHLELVPFLISNYSAPEYSSNRSLVRMVVCFLACLQRFLRKA